jgi:hypothetical protein
MSTGQRTIRCWPHDDQAFASFVEALVRRLGVDPSEEEVDAVVARLRSVYPRARLVPQSGLAAFGSTVSFYAYRDGTPLARPDGVGAMRYRSPVEEALLCSVDLGEIAARRLTAGRAAAAAAKAAIDARRATAHAL